MRILVYGAGVIGGQLCHALCRAGNDVTVIARGQWAETLQKEGLRIRHYIQRTDTEDHPRVLTAPDDGRYDIVFAVMQYRQMEQILSDLAGIDSPLVILTGNNLSAAEMKNRILAGAEKPKQILFGFGSTAGTRENGRLYTVHTGGGRMTIGDIDREVSAKTRQIILQAFKGSRVSVSWCDNMDSWLKYHAAFILPVVYLCYQTGCDLSRADKSDRNLMLEAAADAYHLLMALGYPVRPAGDEKTLEPGLLNTAAKAVIYLVCRTRLGALCTSEHCRHAPQEMEDLNNAFLKLRAERPDFPMPAFDRLYAMMPSWEEIRRIYRKKNGSEETMIRLQNLTENEITEISRQIADAFFDYEYCEEDLGLKKNIRSREYMFTYIHAIVKASMHSGLLYTTSEKQEGYMILSGEGAGSIGFADGMKMIFAEREALGGWKKMKEFISASFSDGGSIETRMRKAKRKFIRIEVLVVRREYQKQGFMKKMMEYVYRIANERRIPLILDTDDRNKCKRYIHLGMKLERVRRCGEKYHMYDLIREPE